MRANRSSRGGEPLDVPEAVELTSVIKRQKGLRTRPGQGLPRRDSDRESRTALGGGAPT
jgi:hypothetical protein